MQFLKVVALGLISGAYASPLVARDAAPILATFADISKALEGLDAGIDGFTATSDAKAVTADLTSKSNALVATLKADTAKVSAASAVSLQEAVTIQTEAQKLTELTSHVIDAFLEKKDIIAKAGQTQLVLHHLMDQSTAAKGFIAAVVSKVPANVQAAANQIAGSVTTAINKGITGFGGMPGMAM